MLRVLLIDDQPAVPLAFLKRLVPPGDGEIVVARTGAEGVAIAASQTPDVVLLDVGLPDATGLDVFRELRRIDARTPVVFITASDAADVAIEAMSAGAFDYLTKPLDWDKLQQVMGEAAAVSRLARGPAVLSPDAAPVAAGRTDVLLGRCPVMRDVYKAIGRVAPTAATVLVLGESGTGKELVARAVYQHSKRAAGPFLAVNCAAIPEGLLESELFGHEKGAFTGADRKRVGKFEQCHGGTLFLDEVGEMTPATQAKLLRVLQDGTFERVGGSETVRADVRVIAATNRDLRAMAEDGRFRNDLYYRLAVFPVSLPPLRLRGDDVDLLARHFVGRYAREFEREATDLAPDAAAALLAYSWPGNVRELQSVIKQAIVQSRGPVLMAGFLPLELTRPPSPAAGPVPTLVNGPGGGEWFRAFARQRLDAGTRDLYLEAVRELERAILPVVLAHTGGNQLQAAEMLGMAPKTLRLKLRDAGLLAKPARPPTAVSDDD
ncbi:MAG: sigma-54-dependent transcriptional regulator [Fimbriiglobus sp.]